MGEMKPVSECPIVGPPRDLLQWKVWMRQRGNTEERSHGPVLFRQKFVAFPKQLQDSIVPST